MIANRRVLVTGANKGIGLALVRALAALPAVEVIMTFRKGNSGLEEFDHIQKECPKALLHYHYLDITDSTSRKELAIYLSTHFGKVDVLVNNAAAGYDEPGQIPPKELARDYLGCNFVSTVALTVELLPILSGDAKVINVSSRVGALENHSEEVREKLRDPNITYEILLKFVNEYIENCEKKNLKGWCSSAYRTSKSLLNCWSRFVLARSLTGNQSVLVMSPGFCNTDMVTRNHNPLLVSAPQPRPPEEGIKTILHCIFEVPFDNSHSGQFFYDCKPWNYQTDR